MVPEHVNQALPEACTEQLSTGGLILESSAPALARAGEVYPALPGPQEGVGFLGPHSPAPSHYPQEVDNHWSVA